MTDQTANLTWRNGVPIATAFDDPYYSLDDGLAETEHVFVSGNGLPARFGGDFQIAELGFGTGLNFLVTWAAWDAVGQPGRLSFTSFEAFPMRPADMADALSRFPQLQGNANALLQDWTPESGSVQFTNGPILEVIKGDARKTVPAWQAAADAWFLDGFSPAKNPELWGVDLLKAVGAHTKPDGTVATYSAAGHIRRGLQNAGFDVSRVPGYGRKRHMTIGRLAHAE